MQRCCSTDSRIWSARAGADGAHLNGIEAFLEAVPALKPDRIAGCGGIHSRHDAMLAAETGADYLMFGEPDAGGRRPTFDAILERVAWWAEVFEIPCVGFAGSLDEVGPLSAAGADFVAVGDCDLRGCTWRRGCGPRCDGEARGRGDGRMSTRRCASSPEHWSPA